jgi:hypothetical protein
MGMYWILLLKISVHLSFPLGNHTNNEMFPSHTASRLNNAKQGQAEA